MTGLFKPPRGYLGIAVYGKISCMCTQVNGSFIWWPLASTDKLSLPQLASDFYYWCPEVFKQLGMPRFTCKNNPSMIGMTRNTGQLHREVRMSVLLSASTRLIFKMSCVDCGIDQSAINCLNSALVIWMLRFVHQVWLCKWGYLGWSAPIHNTFCIVT